WSQLSQPNPFWRRHSTFRDRKALHQTIKAYRQENLDAILSAPNSELTNQSRPTVSLEPILWLTMSFIDRSRCLR
ncbi:hypothetical protein BDF20DRAFT_822218, partial [Mycotypha africana]|uniref:uncharacterized protein n=1 Tax=Mycotypha africana TaxID=64632 RepID=UPI00230199DE